MGPDRDPLFFYCRKVAWSKPRFQLLLHPVEGLDEARLIEEFLAG